MSNKKCEKEEIINDSKLRQIQRKSSEVPQGGEKQQNRGRRLVLGAVAAVLAVVSITIAWLLNKNTDAEQADISLQEAQKQLDAALEAVYHGVSSDNFIAQELEDAVRIEVQSVTNTENGCRVECIVTSLDLATPIREFISTQKPGENATYPNVVSDLRQVIAGAEEIQQTFNVNFICVDGEYKAIMPEEMIVFCNGNIQELLPYLYGILEGGGTK